VFDLFGSSHTGSERITQEFGSNMMAETLSSTMGVTVAAAQAQTSGLGPLKPLFRSLRGVTDARRRRDR
jgi:hypothetical protein